MIVRNGNPPAPETFAEWEDYYNEYLEKIANLVRDRWVETRTEADSKLMHDTLSAVGALRAMPEVFRRAVEKEQDGRVSSL